ncbi:transposase [Streptomyces niveus]|uniref:transposase n=1 Tax=Streptomyces niveus TaxID=193462 RepID=UPI00364A118E
MGRRRVRVRSSRAPVRSAPPCAPRAPAPSTPWPTRAPAHTPRDDGRPFRAVSSSSRSSTSPRPVTAQPPTPRAVTRWILSRPETLTDTEHIRLKEVLANCPELQALTGHVRSFAEMLTERQGHRLPQWLDAIRSNDLPSLHTLAAGIDRDRDAVIAGLTLPSNSGVVEGHANRIKMLKRQMFGRAGFRLLRKRILLS